MPISSKQKPKQNTEEQPLKITTSLLQIDENKYISSESKELKENAFLLHKSKVYPLIQKLAEKLKISANTLVLDKVSDNPEEIKEIYQSFQKKKQVSLEHFYVPKPDQEKEIETSAILENYISSTSGSDPLEILKQHFDIESFKSMDKILQGELAQLKKLVSEKKIKNQDETKIKITAITIAQGGAHLLEVLDNFEMSFNNDVDVKVKVISLIADCAYRIFKDAVVVLEKSQIKDSVKSFALKAINTSFYSQIEMLVIMHTMLQQANLASRYLSKALNLLDEPLLITGNYKIFNRASLYVLAGEIALLNKDFKRAAYYAKLAEGLFDKVRHPNPRYKSLMNSLADYYVEQKMFDEAEVAYRQVLHHHIDHMALADKAVELQLAQVVVDKKLHFQALQEKQIQDNIQKIDKITQAQWLEDNKKSNFTIEYNQKKQIIIKSNDQSFSIDKSMVLRYLPEITAIVLPSCTSVLYVPLFIKGEQIDDLLRILEDKYQEYLIRSYTGPVLKNPLIGEADDNNPDQRTVNDQSVTKMEKLPSDRIKTVSKKQLKQNNDRNSENNNNNTNNLNKATKSEQPSSLTASNLGFSASYNNYKLFALPSTDHCLRYGYYDRSVAPRVDDNIHDQYEKIAEENGEGLRKISRHGFRVGTPTHDFRMFSQVKEEFRSADGKEHVLIGFDLESNHSKQPSIYRMLMRNK